MDEFLVETYASRDTANVPLLSVEDVSLAADRVSEEATEVRLMRAILVPDDETCFYHFKSSSAAAVRAAATRAGLHFDRITKAVSVKPPRAPTRMPVVTETPQIKESPDT